MDSTLDLRSTPTWERLQAVSEAFSALRKGEILRIIYDYEPRPLRRSFERVFSRQYVWHQLRVGSTRWEIALSRVVPPNDGESVEHFLTRCPVFAEASEATRTFLASSARAQIVRRKSTIAHQESDWPYVGVVRKGRVFCIVGTATGRDQILFEVLETEVFGNMVLFDGGATLARFATLAEAAELLLFRKQAVLTCAAEDARFALALAAAATQQTRSIVDLVAAHVSKKTVSRVAAALMPYAPAESGLAAVDPGHLGSLRLTQIAAGTGTVKEVVARAVTELEQAGVIKRVGGRVAYIDRARLARLA